MCSLLVRVKGAFRKQKVFIPTRYSLKRTLWMASMAVSQQIAWCIIRGPCWAAPSTRGWMTDLMVLKVRLGNLSFGCCVFFQNNDDEEDVFPVLVLSVFATDTLRTKGDGLKQAKHLLRGLFKIKVTERKREIDRIDRIVCLQEGDGLQFRV